MTSVPHGGDVYGGEILYDFSANLNPLGLPEGVKNALKNSIGEWEKYPDPYCRELIKKIAAHERFPAENIACGNGAADLIYRIVRAVAPRRAIVPAPAFSEYEKALDESGSEVVLYPLAEEKDFALDEGILDFLGEGVDLLILCSPNNPTGKTIGGELLKRLCGECLQKKIVFLCDECFLDLADGGERRSVKNYVNASVVALKAFTKTYAMAGLRLGYALFGDAALAAKVREIGPFWNVSAPAQVAGIAALDEKEYLKRSVDLIGQERDFLTGALQSFGFKVYPSEANFILFQSDLPLDRLLLKKKILIRSCENFKGLDERFFRVAVRRREENEALIRAIGGRGWSKNG
ncbi:MAG: aminotransferase class I/II-fold pyridoxal phosphate-dependent enzyme [Bacteroides sp.]|nr:aminotransferase class I/II-fold pyridoxal phosphate-dependent enzyme [Eubacterium sp.]MCM1417852.1 aminotransferase class I/II-fold pyridoxal phosphate-dependent enzyme [Roseburia sp.]MCM1461291.1 aminotransferase class I/II-fold pyridoxal phosphate-dependent enzyme [Bacteroides sp.]